MIKKNKFCVSKLKPLTKGRYYRVASTFLTLKHSLISFNTHCLCTRVFTHAFKLGICINIKKFFSKKIELHFFPVSFLNKAIHHLLNNFAYSGNFAYATSDADTRMWQAVINMRAHLNCETTRKLGRELEHNSGSLVWAWLQDDTSDVLLHISFLCAKIWSRLRHKINPSPEYGRAEA